MKNYIQNEEWKDKSQDGVWKLISRISDDIGAVLTDEIVNYTRNVVDINTCKVPQMIENAKMLSYGLEHIKNSYDFLPSRIKCLVDIFSVNSEYLIGNEKNHILTDEVIKEILVYIRENCKDRTPFTNEDVLDKLIDNPHSLVEMNTYKAFVTELFRASISDALSASYSSDTNQPIAFNVLYKEIKKKIEVMSTID